MFDDLVSRVHARAETRARERARELAEEMNAELEPTAAAVAGAEGVTVTGAGIGQSFVLEPKLRWLVLGLVADRPWRKR